MQKLYAMSMHMSLIHLISHYLTLWTILNQFHLLILCGKINCTHMWSINKNNQSNITKFLIGKAWSWKPELYIMYHGIIWQSSYKAYQALSIVKSSYTNQVQFCKSMHRSLPPVSLPPLRNPCWRIALNEFELILPWLCSPHWKLQCVCDAINASL